MSLVRRIGTTSLMYRDPGWEKGCQKDRDAVVAYIREAGRLDVDILLFQEEYSFAAHELSAYPGRKRFSPAEPSRPPVGNPSYADLAISLDHEYVEQVRAVSSEAGVNVVLPTLERDGRFVYNSLVPITKAGEVLRPYRKMFPVAGYEDLGEMEHACPGDDNSAQLIADIPVSFAICFDAHFDEVFAAARGSGAKLVLWSSMWMGGLWLRSQAIRYGLHLVSSTPDGCTFVDMDGTVIAESFTMWPQTAGFNNLMFEDINFDKDIFHCYSQGRLDKVLGKYGPRVHIENRPQDSIAVLESLDPDLRIEDIKEEFGLMCWYDYIQRSREARNEAQRRWSHIE